ncbi:hypothetical protein CLOM_g11163 [Closterium sp. NIES-68]|nr:hypothetical protein CLOM_g11163 [Closterium sp. NIES-68]GJP79585.1 hypothetical protein CLOP_g9803 [Closterium sp. NIES-67]
MLGKGVTNDSNTDAQGITYDSKADGQEIPLAIEPAEEEQDKEDMTLSFPAAGKTTNEDDVQNTGMVTVNAGGQLADVQNRGTVGMNVEFEGEATGVDELDQVI